MIKKILLVMGSILGLVLIAAFPTHGAENNKGSLQAPGQRPQSGQDSTGKTNVASPGPFDVADLAVDRGGGSGGDDHLPPPPPE